MKFIDEARIEVQAGRGGAGCVHFRREKYVPFGGPDGGNGGKGGSVILVADANTHTLLDFRHQPRWEAQDGAPGEGSQCDGRWGADLKIKVPVGTQVLIADNSELAADLTLPGAEYVVAKGGRGGKGNTFFKTATNQAPRYAQPGEPGESGAFVLSLKLIADVGLVGFPNAGKSTLIARISAARPKIADYPFTTLVPHLGVVSDGTGSSFVVADVPGLIPGAHAGKGLGIQFLKHLERTKLLAHLIDPLQLDEQGRPVPPAEAFAAINHELASFSSELAAREQIVVLTKLDAAPPEEVAAALRHFSGLGLRCIAVSSVAGKGIPEFVRLLGEAVRARRALSEPPASPQ